MPERAYSPSIQLIWQLVTFGALVVGGHLAALLISSPILLLSSQAASVVMFGASSAAVLCASYLMIRWWERAPLSAIGIGFDRPWLSHSAIGFLLGTSFVVLIWLLFQVGGWLRAEFRPSALSHWPQFIIELVLFCAVAFHEELLCRGYAFQILFRRNKVVAVLLPGLIFVALHLTNVGGTQPIALLNLFLAHVLFSVCYLRTRSLWFPIGLHAGWNFTMADVVGLPVSGDPPSTSLFAGEPAQNALTGFAFGPEGGLVVTVLLVAAIFAISRFVRQRHPAPDLLAYLPEPAMVPGAETLPHLPTQTADRVLAIDVLRGMAVLSILPLNMEIFALVPQAVVHPYAGLYTDSTNLVAWVALRLLVGTLGLSLFSLLFGAGLLMFEGSRGQQGTASPSSESATVLHYRRLAVLAVIGLLHAYLIWAGDILVTYAIVGALIWLFRGMRPRTLITLGVLSFAVPMLLLIIAHLLAPHFSQDFRQGIHAAVLPSAEEIAHLDEAYRSGWLGQMNQRFSDALANQTLNLFACMGWIAGGMMLVGMGFYKRGILTAKASKRSYWAMIAVAALAGYPLLIYGFVWNFRHEWRVPEGFFLGWAMRETAYPIIMMGWIGAVMLLCKAGRLKPLTLCLGAVGQMALTNYLMQSVLCHLIFYGTGLGLVDKVDIPTQIAITLAIWIVQLLYSPIWLALYRFGPVEWLWRSLSYGRWFNLRIGGVSGERAAVGAPSQA